jgi:hypothetical protein
MKNLLFTLILLVAFGTTANAQYDYWPYLEKAKERKNYIEWRAKFRDSILQNHISYSTTVKKIYNKKGIATRSITKSELQFDAKGDVISAAEYDNKGRLTNKLILTYYDNGIPRTSKRYDAKGNFVRGWEIELNDKGLMTKRTSFWKKEGKIAWGQDFEYNAEGNIIKCRNFDNKNNIYVTVEYDYYNDGSPKETRTYNKKGKLKTVLKYDCQPTGTLANGKKTDTSTVCTKSVYDADSNRIDTREVIMQNGKIWRHITIVNRIGQIIESKSIDTKGRQAYQYKYAYYTDGKIKEFYYSGFKRWQKGYKDVYTYNENNQRTTTTRYNKSDRILYEVRELTR